MAKRKPRARRSANTNEEQKDQPAMSEENTNPENVGEPTETDTNTQDTTPETTTTPEAGSDDSGQASTPDGGDQVSSGGDVTDAPIEPAPTSDSSSDEPIVDGPDAADVADADVIEPTGAKQADSEEGLSALLKMLKNDLANYSVEMARNAPVDANVIGRNQLKLLNMLKRVLKMEGKDFTDGMRLIITTAKEHRNSCFAEGLLFRGMDSLRVTSSDRKLMEAVLNLILAAADSDTMTKIDGTVDFGLVRKHIDDESAAQRLMSFFNVS